MSNILPAITLYQPWATWIMRGWKTIETRIHNRFACLKDQIILIHAGKRTDDSDAVIRNPYLTREQLLYKPEEVINGCILGRAFVYDFDSLSDGWSKDALIDCGNTLRYGLYLKDITTFDTPIPVNGEMGIWYFDLDKKIKVKKPDLQPKLFSE